MASYMTTPVISVLSVQIVSINIHGRIIYRDMFEFVMPIRTKTIQDFEKFFLNVLRGRIEVDDAEEALVEYKGREKSKNTRDSRKVETQGFDKVQIMSQE